MSEDRGTLGAVLIIWGALSLLIGLAVLVGPAMVAAAEAFGVGNSFVVVGLVLCVLGMVVGGTA